MKKKIIIIILILIFLIMWWQIKSSIELGKELNQLNNMNKDIIILDDSIYMYYLENGNIPINNQRKIEFKSKSINPNDNENYYEINLELLQNLNLTYGSKKISEDDIYIINEETHTIYYQKGIKYDNQIYYTKNAEYEYFNLEEYK